ncbi:MAG: hypothetical protein ACRDSE_12930 [Pseudonocardiaceae bacterium]
MDLPRLLDGKRALVESLRQEKYTGLAAEYGWDILAGTARFTATGSGLVLGVDGAGGVTTEEAEHYLIATGSAPRCRRSTGWPGPAI